MIEAVADLIHRAASDVIMPRYKTLERRDVHEKTPGEIVTVADRDAEAILSRGLAQIRPSASIVGEEACAESPAALDSLMRDEVWLVDPLDGTKNFATGEGPFAVMVALLSKGECLASWMFDPVAGRMCIAERGGGAFINGDRVRSDPSAIAAADLIGSVGVRFMPSDMQAEVKERMRAFHTILPLSLCAGFDYPDLVFGQREFIVYWRTLPWDHAPGSLFLTEAGGRVARPDGTPYRVCDGRSGLLATRTPQVWDTVAPMLFP